MGDYMVLLEKICLECLDLNVLVSKCKKCGGRGTVVDLRPVRNALVKIFEDAKKTAQKMREENNALNDSIIQVLEERVLFALKQFESK